MESGEQTLIGLEQLGDGLPIVAYLPFVVSPAGERFAVVRGNPDLELHLWVMSAYGAGKALNQAARLGIDETIDSAELGTWVAKTLKARKPPAHRPVRKRLFIDGW